MERMSIIVQGRGNVIPDGHRQEIFPDFGFTCSGHLLDWVFGAKWEGNSASFTELQIWRPTNVYGVFTKVSSTTIMTTQTILVSTTVLSPLLWPSKQEMY